MTHNAAYRKAERKIEEAQRSGATELDLSQRYGAEDSEKLTELPASLWELTALRTLNLHNNQLTALPEEIGQLTALQTLDLSSTQLTALPESIDQLTALQSLYLYDNRWKGISKLIELLMTLPALLSLDLSGNKLTKLPESIGQLTALQELNLSYNQLIALPESIGQLTMLQDLNLRGNSLTMLPEAIGQLTMLRSLDLYENHLVALPEFIGQLTMLQELDLHGNFLTALPEATGQLTQLKTLHLQMNQLTELPHSLGSLSQLQLLNLTGNPLLSLPESLGNLYQLKRLGLSHTHLNSLPEFLRQLKNLQALGLADNGLTSVPHWLVYLTEMEFLYLGREEGIIGRYGFGFKESNRLSSLPEWLSKLENLSVLKTEGNQLTDLPLSLTKLEHLEELDLDDNPLDLELAAAYEQGLDAVMAYLRARAEEQIVLNEAKLILVGEGEVGKTCLMDALAGAPWREHESTHGIQIRPVEATDAESGRVITLNGWDFGGQRVYRPTHQLFFSAPAVYLVVWKPREGPQQGFVKEWIELITQREPEAKILVVATHGGPGGRQPDIDRQELWDLFDRETVLDFYHVESKPDDNNQRRGIDELKGQIARVAAELPEVGRSVPKSFQAARQALIDTDEAYLPLERVNAICYEQGLEPYTAQLFVAISHRLGHLIHYAHDPLLRNIVVLKPDWLATAISFVLDDEVTREQNGLVPFSRLTQLWDNPARKDDERYPEDLHPIFLRLMERFDLSYRVAGLHGFDDSDPVSLIAQLVSDTRPQEKLETAWSAEASAGDQQQMQICRIADEQSGQSATAEGLFYQLIVRLHHLSLGRNHFDNSVHWQRGLVLDNDYNGRALLVHHGNDVHITVRAAYPQGFLSRLTDEVKYLVESFWEGLRCDVMVRCLETPSCAGLFEVSKLIENKRRGRPEQPCSVCNEWQEIDRLLTNAPAARPDPARELLGSPAVIREIRELRTIVTAQHGESIGRFDGLAAGQKELLSKADAAFDDLMRALTDEAKEGPRLFTLMPVNRSGFNPRSWVNHQFRLTLWCEHSRRPLPILNGLESTQGVYEIELSREWFKRAAPFLKVLNVTLSLVLPVSTAGYQLAVDDAAFEAINEQLDFGSEVINASLSGGEQVGDWLSAHDDPLPKHGQSPNDPVRARGAVLRELHHLLKERDPGFGGLVRVQNKRREFLWVHEQFEGEY